MADDASNVTIEFTDAELDANVPEQPEQPKGNENEPAEQAKTNTPAEGVEKQEPSSSNDEDGKAPEGNAAPVAKTNAELAVLYGTSEEEVAYAKNMGWSPRENFKGNPNDWKEPKQFIEIAEQSAPVLRERMRAMSKELAEVRKAFPTILEMQKRDLKNRIDDLESRNKDLEKELEDAHLMADSKRAAELTEKIYDNKLKKAIEEERLKHVGEQDGMKSINQKVITPEGIDVEKEKAWRETIWPRLSIEQREVYNEAVQFLINPLNADKTTDERIAYLEGKLFGSSSRPSAAPVARPTAANVTAEPAGSNNEYAGWDALTDEEKRVATSMLVDYDWYQNRNTDPKAKAKWNEFKKQFTTK